MASDFSAPSHSNIGPITFTLTRGVEGELLDTTNHDFGLVDFVKRGR